MNTLKSLLKDLEYKEGLLHAYDGEDKEVREELRAGIAAIRAQLEPYRDKVNGNDAKDDGGNGGNGKNKGKNGGNGKGNGGHEKDSAVSGMSETDEPVLHDDATDEPICSRESA